MLDVPFLGLVALESPLCHSKHHLLSLAVSNAIPVYRVHQSISSSAHQECRGHLHRFRPLRPHLDGLTC